jgi:AcrR family transcriptional regulator
VRQRAEAMRRTLVLRTPEGPASLLETLEGFGREFLALLTDPTTIAVYRLATAEASRSPELGRALDGLGRGMVWEALRSWMGQARDRGLLAAPDPDRAAGSFMALLMGDLVVRLMLGAVPTPDQDEIARRAAAARAGFARLWLP